MQGFVGSIKTDVNFCAVLFQQTLAEKKKIHIIYSSFSIVKAFTKDLCFLGG